MEIKNLGAENKNLVYDIKPNNFIAPVFNPEDYVFGAKQLPEEVLREDGQWLDFLTPFEDQKRKIETSACATYGTLHILGIILEEKFGILDTNFADRFNATLSGTTKLGTSPHTTAESVRKNGVIPEEDLPFDDSINTWEEYYAPIPTNLINKGKQWLQKFSFMHEWVFDTKIPNKQSKMMKTLRFSPLGVSVYAWVFDNDKNVYVKPEGMNDNHWCVCIGYKENEYWIIKDTYAPYVKHLDWDYDFSFSKRYYVEKKTETSEETIEVIPITYYIKRFFQFIINIFK